MKYDYDSVPSTAEDSDSWLPYEVFEVASGKVVKRCETIEECKEWIDSQELIAPDR